MEELATYLSPWLTTGPGGNHDWNGLCWLLHGVVEVWGAMAKKRGEVSSGGNKSSLLQARCSINNFGCFGERGWCSVPSRELAYSFVVSFFQH